MKYISMLSTKRLQRYKARGRLGKSPLVPKFLRTSYVHGPKLYKKFLNKFNALQVESRRLAWNATSKVGSLNNVKHKAGENEVCKTSFKR